MGTNVVLCYSLKLLFLQQLAQGNLRKFWTELNVTSLDKLL